MKAPSFLKGLELEAEYECSLWMLKKILLELQRPSNPIEQMVDEATGYKKERFRKLREEAIALVKNIIKCKRRLGEDITFDKEVLKKMKDLKEA